MTIMLFVGIRLARVLFIREKEIWSKNVFKFIGCDKSYMPGRHFAYKVEACASNFS